MTGIEGTEWTREANGMQRGDQGLIKNEIKGARAISMHIDSQLNLPHKLPRPNVHDLLLHLSTKGCTTSRS